MSGGDEPASGGADKSAEHRRPDVFLNCPFDEQYLELFEACVFTIYVAGYAPCCALSEDDFGNIRLDKLRRMIEACDLTIHDLSRTGAGAAGFARLNMPFELGMAIGAKFYGDTRQRQKRILCMVEKRFDMPKFLSDVAGNDPSEHGRDPRVAIKPVRNWLLVTPGGERLIGPSKISAFFETFKSSLPKILSDAGLKPNEINSFDGHYGDFLAVLEDWVRAAQPRLTVRVK